MAVLADRVIGTGGWWPSGALCHGRRALPPAGEPGELQVRYALGPALGQCCGGVVHPRFTAGHRCRQRPTHLQGPAPRPAPVVLFAPYVNHALAPRAGAVAFADVDRQPRRHLPPHARGRGQCEHSESVQACRALLQARSQCSS